MMEKLIIAGRTNWENKVYVKIEAQKDSMKVIKKILNEMGDEFFVDNQTIPKSLSNYEKWKDQWISVVTKEFEIDIICGDKFIHIIIYKFPNFDAINKIFDKYCDWAQIKYKKGFGPLPLNE